MNKVIDNVMEAIKRIVDIANNKLQKMTGDKFPFTFEEVEMTVESDSAGIYVRSGLTPVVAVARAGNPDGVINEIKDKIWVQVDCTRTAIERRSGLKEEVEQLEAEGEKQLKAKAALEAAGLSTDMLNGVNAEAAEAVLAAARKAVRKANIGLLLQFGTVSDLFGGVQNMKMKVIGYVGGFVITAGGKPCMITRYPKLATSTDRMIRYIHEEVAALNQSRREYFSYLREKMDQEERLRELAAKLDSLNAELAVMA